MPEDNGTPIRDIVIETRVDVRHIREALDKISECIKDHDDRLREIEMCGSKTAQETAGNLVRLKVRVTNLESAEEIETSVEKAKGHWIDSFWAKAGIITGIFFAAAAFIKSWWFS